MDQSLRRRSRRPAPLSPRLHAPLRDLARRDGTGARLALNPNRPRLLLRAEVAALVALGRHDEVEKCIADAARHPGGPTLAATLMLESSVELRGHGLPADGRRMAERALASLRSIPESTPDAAGRRRLVLAPLLGYPPFEELMKPKG